jgi:hypothetical protein
MIDAHPSLHCNGEHDYLFDHVRFDLATNRWLIDRDKLLLDRVFLAHDIKCPETSDAKVAIDYLLAQLREKGGGKFVAMIHRNLATAIALLNDPLIIHLIRDPRDVAASSIGMGWAGNVYFGADHWVATETEWMTVSPELHPSSVFTLRFERLIADPSSQLTDLCGFVGVDYSSQMLEYHRTSTYEPVDPSLATQWCKKRTAKELALIELRVGDLLASSGFEPSIARPINLGLFGQAMLWFQKKVYRWRVRIERYGLLDSVWVAMARRLGIEAWAAPAIRRMHERTKLYLK